MSGTSRNFSGGTKLKVKVAGVFRDIMGITSIPGFTTTTDDVEATELDPYAGLSTTPAVYKFIKKKLAGWVDLGELSFEANITADEYTSVNAYQLAGTDLYFRIDLRSGYSIGVYGHFKSVAVSNQPTELSKMPVTISLTDQMWFGAIGSIPAAWDDDA